MNLGSIYSEAVLSPGQNDPWSRRWECPLDFFSRVNLLPGVCEADGPWLLFVLTAFAWKGRL